jgi:hypothetical protein
VDSGDRQAWVTALKVLAVVFWTASATLALVGIILFAKHKDPVVVVGFCGLGTSVYLLGTVMNRLQRILGRRTPPRASQSVPSTRGCINTGINCRRPLR